MLNVQDLTDEAYLKRHQRLEMDEKRRKRWDLQRQRELSAYEHLRRDDGHTSGRSSSPDMQDGNNNNDNKNSWQCLWCRHMTQVIARVHAVYLMNVEQRQASVNLQTKPVDLEWVLQ